MIGNGKSLFLIFLTMLGRAVASHGRRSCTALGIAARASRNNLMPLFQVRPQFPCGVLLVERLLPTMAGGELVRAKRHFWAYGGAFLMRIGASSRI